jgi:hypothetical protein
MPSNDDTTEQTFTPKAARLDLRQLHIDHAAQEGRDPTEKPEPVRIHPELDDSEKAETNDDSHDSSTT